MPYAVSHSAAQGITKEDRWMAQTGFVQDLSILSQMADAMPQLVWIDAADGRPEYVNRRWCEYTGQTISEALNAWTSCLHPEDRTVVTERLNRAFHSGETYETRCRYRRHDGVYRWFLNRATAAYGFDGRPLRWFGTATDIHDLVETKDRLRSALKEAEEHRRLLDVLMEHIPIGLLVAEVTSGGSELVLRKLSRFAQEIIRLFASVQHLRGNGISWGQSLSYIEPLRCQTDGTGERVDLLEGNDDEHRNGTNADQGPEKAN